jgi:glycosyltransferase involved in cell wall biosynthesis
LADKQAFELHADVPDVVAYYEHATVVVAPIWAGSGTRIKILEAFSFGLPVVSTSLGAEGLGTVDGQHLLIADTPSSFAQKIVSLLGDEALRHRLAREADELLERDFTPDAIRQRVGQILEGDTSRRPG